MIKATEYDFMNIDCPQAIHVPANDAFFSKVTPLPAYQDWAYAGEIYWTHKMMQTYSMGQMGDTFTGTPPLPESIPMMPKRELWKERLNEIRSWWMEDGLRPRGTFGGYLGQWQPEFISSQQPTYAVITNDNILNMCMVASDKPNLPEANDGMMPAYESINAWDREAAILYSTQFSNRHFYNVYPGTNWCRENYFPSGLFNASGVQWNKNGQYTPRPPTRFPLNGMNYFYMDERSVNPDDTDRGEWSYEFNRLWYNFSAPPWQHRRMMDSASYVEFNPVFRIAMFPMWKFSNASTGHETFGHFDKKYHDRIWMPNKYHPIDIAYPPKNGGEWTVTFAESGVSSSATLGQWVVSKVGARNWSYTSPEEPVTSGYTASHCGCYVAVSVCGWLMYRSRIPRNLNNQYYL